MTKPIVSSFRCLAVSNSGPNGEPIGCGYNRGHKGDHSWATLPSFVELRRAWEDFDQQMLDKLILGTNETPR